TGRPAGGEPGSPSRVHQPSTRREPSAAERPGAVRRDRPADPPDNPFGDRPASGGARSAAAATPEPTRPERAAQGAPSGQAEAEGAPEAREGLSREEISRVVRQNHNEIRYCYELGLQRDPTLGGRVEVEMVIASRGEVASASARRSTLGDDQVGECILSHVRRWRFPAPGGVGVARVTYPFELQALR
ncbi:MAG: AgmX/PglI C-terminal domain-containing protein, partial [Sandaracinaceae bacterium]